MERWSSSCPPSQPPKVRYLKRLKLKSCTTNAAAAAVQATDYTLPPSQSLVAKALGVPANRVVIRVKRMGGGFGGKESRTTILSTVVAVAANRYVSRSLVQSSCETLLFLK